MLGPLSKNSLHFTENAGTWRCQDVKHIIIFCQNHTHNRQKLYKEAGTDRYQEILSTREGLRAVARGVMKEGLLAQFSLAKEQIDLLEGRTSNGGNSDADGNGDGGGDGGDEDEGKVGEQG